jgi:ankyrin repeat protein
MNGDNRLFYSLVKNNNYEEIKRVFDSLLINQETLNKSLVAAITSNNLELIEFLIANGSDVEYKNGLPLKTASLKENLQTISILIENGANINTNNGFVLRMACTKNNLEMIKLLLNLGADINVGNLEASLLKSPLSSAAGKGNIEIVKLLLEYKIEIPYLNNALSTALFKNNLEIAKLLIENGADINSLNERDEPFLITAYKKNQFDKIKFLIQQEADIHVKEDYLIRFASRDGHYDLVKLLLENDADYHVKNDTPLILASKNGHLNIVKLLADNDEDQFADSYRRAIIKAEENNHSDVVEYLKSLFEDEEESETETEEEEKEDYYYISEKGIYASPDEEATETIILDENYIHTCNIINDFELNEETGKQEPLDPLTIEHIPSDLIVSVKRIKDINNEQTTCFNALSIYKHWKTKSKLKDYGVPSKYADNPFNRGYFNSESIIYIETLLTKLNLI